jgi:hypothetical protein
MISEVEQLVNTPHLCELPLQVRNPFGIDEEGTSPNAESCASISLLLLKQNNNKAERKKATFLASTERGAVHAIFHS